MHGAEELDAMKKLAPKGSVWTCLVFGEDIEVSMKSPVKRISQSVLRGDQLDSLGKINSFKANSAAWNFLNHEGLTSATLKVTED